MSFTGNEGSIVTLENASKLTEEYRKTISPGDTIANAVGKNLVESILAQPGCMGIRFYYALNEQGNKQLVLVGVDENGNDLTEGNIVDQLPNCPPRCSIANPLNSKI